MLSKDNLDEILSALDRQIKALGGSSVSLVVCGGTALFALRLVLRTTKDIDVLGTVSKEYGVISVRKIDKFPDFLIKAAGIVQRDFRLPARWLNKGPTSQVESGLPQGFEKRLVEKHYGEYLSIYYISRRDQSEEEIHAAAKWVLTQDVSSGFKLMVKNFLRRNGYESISEKI